MREYDAHQQAPTHYVLQQDVVAIQSYDDRATARPRPDPPVSRFRDSSSLKNGRKIFSRLASAMPGPSSETVISIWSISSVRVTPAFQPYLIALETILPKALLIAPGAQLYGRLSGPVQDTSAPVSAISSHRLSTRAARSVSVLGSSLASSLARANVESSMDYISSMSAMALNRCSSS
jgi:hypothetical protein